MNPLLYQISMQRWEYFLTLTYRSRDDSGNLLKVPDQKERSKLLLAFLRRAAEGNKRDRKTGNRLDTVPFSHFLWVAREERGEIGGRYHFHILLAGFPPSRINQVERFSLKSIWTSLGGGHADCRAFDSRLSGAQYVLKGLEGWSQRNANSFEMRRFNEEEDRSLIVAKACAEKWARRTKQRASEGSHSGIPAVTLSASRKTGSRNRAKDSFEDLENRIRQNWLNHHPAGLSFVR